MGLVTVVTHFLHTIAQAMALEAINLTEVEQSVQLLKLNGYSMTTGMGSSDYIKLSGWNVGGHDWVIFLGEVIPASRVGATIRCRLVHPAGDAEPSAGKSVSKVFVRSGSSVDLWVIRARDVPNSDYLVDDSLTMECTIAVLKDLKDVTIAPPPPPPLPVPSSDMHQHFGELLLSQTGADVTFSVSGESFAAHKLVLAARSPVFMAEFFGGMEERSSKCVEIGDMDAGVFKAMLGFIYTDTVPELEEEEEPDQGAVAMAQHLLAAADRYGLGRLKLICKGKLAGGVDVDTAATTLALAEQHSCSLLKAKCVEFITGSPEKLDAVLATEGYKHLVASCPVVLTELLKAAHGRKK
ncbi:hypothetical protein ACP4OV_014090 [Aristida adscensionis]